MTKKTGKSIPPLIEEVLPTLAQLHIPTAVAVPFGDPDTQRYAVGINAVKGGLKVFVERYPRMLLGDFIEVFWNGATTAAAYTTVDDFNLDTRIGLNIPASEIKSGPVAPYYRLTAVSLTESTSPSRDIWVKLDIPGGPNPVAGAQENKNLVAPIVPPDVAQSGVNKGRAQSGVEITIQPYPNMAEYDRIEFWWGGQRVWVLVQPNQVGQPVRFMVSEQTILAAGDGEIVLRYQLIDAALNFSEGWSLSTKIKVTASNTQLAAPEVDAAVNDILDLAVLAGKDADVHVLAMNSPFAKGDTIELLWEGRSADGGEVNYSASLTLQRFPQALIFRVPYAKVAAIAQGSAIVSYTLRKPDGTSLPSLRTQVSIKGKVLSLPAPVVIQANAGNLDHDLPLATVRIAPYASMASKNEVTLIWVGQRADGQPTYYHSSVIVTSSTVGRDILFDVPGTEIAALTGGTVDVYYRVRTTVDTEVPAQESAHLKLQVTGNIVLFPAPTVTQANGEQLDPALTYADALVPAYPGISLGDDVQLQWYGDRTHLYSDSQTVETIPEQVSGVSFRVYGENIIGNLDNYVTISYLVMRNGVSVGRSADLRLRVGAVQTVLPAPFIVQANGNILITTDVPASGASVRITAAARLSVGDSGTVHWRGQAGAGTADIPFTVSQTDQDLNVIVPYAVVAANNGYTITVDYTVTRKGSGAVQTSQSASYEVRASSRTGRLLVMGARSRTGRDRHEKGMPHFLGQSSLAALDAHTLQPIEVLWRYSSQADADAVSDSRFVDTKPTEVLEAHALGERVQIRPRNLTGSGQLSYERVFTHGAFAAQRDTGSLMVWGSENAGGSFPLNSTIPDRTDITDVIANDYAFAAISKTKQVVAWGEVDLGGKIPPDGILKLNDIVEVVPSRRAFAARRSGGQIIAWGSQQMGGVIPANGGIPGLTNIVDIISNGRAFAGLLRNGQVVAWGESNHGGIIPPESGISELVDIFQVVGSVAAFAALYSTGKAAKAGKVVAWGGDNFGGGIIPPDSGISQIEDIVKVVASSEAFAALRNTGQVVAWGRSDYGGSIPSGSVVRTLTDIKKVVPNWYAFAALRQNGQVVTWGSPENGGTIPPESGIDRMIDIVEIVPSRNAFAARRATGQVVVWGNPDYGGIFPENSLIPGSTDIVQVVAGAAAFAALRSDGTVVAWGEASNGGVIPMNIAQKLTDVRAIYANNNAFVALTADNRVISWGDADNGGYKDNKSMAPSALQGSISYEINGSGVK